MYPLLTDSYSYIDAFYLGKIIIITFSQHFPHRGEYSWVVFINSDAAAPPNNGMVVVVLPDMIVMI